MFKPIRVKFGCSLLVSWDSTEYFIRIETYICMIKRFIILPHCMDFIGIKRLLTLILTYQEPIILMKIHLDHSQWYKKDHQCGYSDGEGGNKTHN